MIFGRQISIKDNITQIKRFRERQLGDLEEVERLRNQIKSQDADNPNLPFWLLALDYGKYVNEAYIQWAEKALADLRNMKD